MRSLIGEFFGPLALIALGLALAAGPTVAGWAVIVRAVARERRRAAAWERECRRRERASPSCLTCRKGEHGGWFVLHYHPEAKGGAR